MFGEKAGLTTPVTEMARTEKRIRVVSGRGARGRRRTRALRLAALRP